MLLFEVIWDIFKLPWYFLEMWVRGHELLVRKCYHWFVIIAFTAICAGQPNYSFAETNRRLDAVEKANAELRRTLEQHRMQGGHSVMEARMKRVEEVQTESLRTQGEILKQLAVNDGIVKGVGIAFGALQLLIAILGFLGYKKVVAIVENTSKLKTQGAN